MDEYKWMTCSIKSESEFEWDTIQLQETMTDDAHLT